MTKASRNTSSSNKVTSASSPSPSNECVMFQNIGLSKEKALETANNPKLAPVLSLILDKSELPINDISKAIGALFYNLATMSNKATTPHLPFLSRQIALGHLKSNDQVQAAIKFFDKIKQGTAFDKPKFEQECGIGIDVSHGEIVATVSDVIDKNRDKVMTDRYRSLGFILGQVRNTRLRWGNAAAVKAQVDAQLLSVLGPKDVRDDPKLLKQKLKESAAAPKQTKPAHEEPKLDPEAMLRTMILEGEIARLHKPGENPQAYPERMNQHLRFSGGKVITRFPPEPNGFLHIGHAKAINIDFGYAQLHDGHCYLRFDDTNPDAEEERYFDTIRDTVQWLGFKPWKVTYSSDYFEQLYQLAVQLIKFDKAYVCYCTPDQIYEQRGGADKGARFACAHRSTPILESIAAFEKMRQGRFPEGGAILRMKMDLSSGNPQFWDLAAYRIRYTAHYRTGSTWCIYPTYDYTHCLVDSMENITHSLCTLEFRQSRESYYWLVDALKLYKPVQWESGRLNVNNTVMSKRKLHKLVTGGIVNGWDDPRLYTIVGLRRRGVPAAAINMFVRSTGVTTTNSLTEVTRLDRYVRSVLNDTAPRLFAVLDPVKVVIKNVKEDLLEWFEVPNNPRDESAGVRKVPFAKVIYIEREDFRTTKSTDFYRLAPGQSVGLLQVPYPITYVSHTTNEDGSVCEICVQYENSANEFRKPKTYIQWVAHVPELASPVPFEARVYNPLFLHAFPEDVPGGWLSDINPDSLRVLTTSVVEVGVRDHVCAHMKTVKGYISARRRIAGGSRCEASHMELCSVEALRFQFMRVGYFCVDVESDISSGDPSAWTLVFNKTIGLKEDVGK